MYRAVAESYQAFDLSGMSSENPYAERSQHLLNTQVDETYTDATELGDIDHIYDYIDMKQMAVSTCIHLLCTVETEFSGLTQKLVV